MADSFPPLCGTQRMEGGAPMVRPGSNGGDANGDYAFVKYNKKIVRAWPTQLECVLAAHSPPPPQEMLDYNDIEWNILSLAGGPDGTWGRGETDYLMGLCRAFDLRWQVIADRYSWADPDAAADAPPRQRPVDELKARYYGLAHTLLLSRTESVEQVAHKELVKRPFDASAEADRRDMLAALLTRSTGTASEEEALLAAAAGVEARRRSEVEGAHKAGLPLQVLCRPAAPPPSTQPPGGGAAKAGGGAGAAAVASLLGKLVIPDISLGPGDVDPNEEPGGPDLPTPRGQSQLPPPGCYARAAHTAACAQELVALGGAGTQAKPRDRKAADSLNRRIDLAMDELGVPAPQTGTRAVCRAWYALRKEVAQLLEVRVGRPGCALRVSLPLISTHPPCVRLQQQLRSQLARKSKESAAAAAVVAGVAGHGGGQPFSPLGGMSSPKVRACALVAGTACVDASDTRVSLATHRRQRTRPPLSPPPPLPLPASCPACRHPQAACCRPRTGTAPCAPTSARRRASGRRTSQARPRRGGEDPAGMWGRPWNAQHCTRAASQLHPPVCAGLADSWQPGRSVPLAGPFSCPVSMRAMAGPLAVGAAPCRLRCRQPSAASCSVGAAGRSTRPPVAALQLPARRVRVQRTTHRLTGTSRGSLAWRLGGCSARCPCSAV